MDESYIASISRSQAASWLGNNDKPSTPISIDRHTCGLASTWPPFVHDCHVWTNLIHCDICRIPTFSIMCDLALLSSSLRSISFLLFNYRKCRLAGSSHIHWLYRIGFQIAGAIIYLHYYSWNICMRFLYFQTYTYWAQVGDENSDKNWHHSHLFTLHGTIPKRKTFVAPS